MTKPLAFFSWMLMSDLDICIPAVIAMIVQVQFVAVLPLDVPITIILGSSIQPNGLGYTTTMARTITVITIIEAMAIFNRLLIFFFAGAGISVSVSGDASISTQ